MLRSEKSFIIVAVFIRLTAIVLAGYAKSVYPTNQGYSGHSKHSDGCPKHEQNSSCYNPCFARTCENLNPSTRICPLYCIVGVCDCIDDYRRLNETCVPETQCPQYCPKSNETKSNCYNECLNSRACPGVRGPDQACTKECQIDVCDCEDGYLRNECGDCVLEAECPNGCSCPENESIQCVNSCSKTTCAFILSGAQKRCRPYCSRQCECIEGYARLDTGECVPEAYCCV